MTRASLPYLVCELANSHGGVASVVDELIAEFANLRYPLKAIKFQVFSANTIALPDFPSFNVYQKLQFDPGIWSAFIKHAASHGDVWIDVFDAYSIRILEENRQYVAGLKLQASVLENQEVIDALQTMDLSTIRLAINVSGFDIDEVARFVTIFGRFSQRLILQIGFQAYPTALEDTALQKIAILRAAFPGVPISMADHADGNDDFSQLAPVYSYLLGCDYIEKHLCLNRAEAPYDGFSALEPSQIQRVADRIRAVSSASSGQFVGPAERRYLEKSVQVPVLREDRAAGSRLTPADVLFRRTGQQGIPWSKIDALQCRGFILARNCSAGQTLDESCFRKASVAAVVACRMKSSRLPRKALVPIAGVPSVERCLRQCLATPGVDQVILATSTHPEDAVLEAHLCDGAAKFWAGDPDDVISRYLGACEHYGVDLVVRVTADCPLVSPEILTTLLEAHFQSGADYTAAASAAVGTAGEIINVSALRTIIDRLGRAEHSEYMTWYFRNNPELFKINLVDLPAHMVRDYRLTLDHQEDLDMFEEVLRFLDETKASFSLEEIFKVLDAHPRIAALNAHIDQRYGTDQSLISMLNEKTRIPVVPSHELGKSRSKSIGSQVLQ